MQKRLLALCFFFFVFVLQTSSAGAQSGLAFQAWADETLADIERDYGIAGSNLAREHRDRVAVAYNWPQGILFHALIADGRRNQAESMANELHQRYWCLKNNIWGYSSSADTCAGRFYDDNAWIAKGMMELYSLTGNSVYVDRARQIIAFSMSGENAESQYPGGGIRWAENNPDGQCVCATAPTTVANLMIYRVTGEQKYFDDGLRLYNWLRANFYRVGPGLRGYENAVMVQAALELFKITGDSTYYDDARRMGIMMETAYIDYETRALRESGKWGGHDMVAAYVDLWEVDGDINWLNIAAGMLRFAYTQLQGGQGRYPVQWDGSSTENSLLLLDNASMARGFAELGNSPGGERKPLEGVGLYNNCDFSNWFSLGLNPGQYTQADLQYLGLNNNTVSALKVQPGFRVTLFDNDNFSGESVVKTGSDACLDDDNFNNRATSVIVEAIAPVAAVFEHCNFNGRGVFLQEGRYNLFDLQARGMRDKNISSLQVPAGFELLAYRDADFRGEASVLTANDNCLVDNGLNDQVSSLILRPVGSNEGGSSEGWLRLENKEHQRWLQGTTFADGSGEGNNLQAVSTDYRGNKTRWRLQAIDGDPGYYRLENQATGLWLQMMDSADVTAGQPNGSSDADTHALRLVDNGHGGDWTRWRKVGAGDGWFYLENKAFGYYLQVTNIIDVDCGGFDGGVQVRGVPSHKEGGWTRFREVSL